MGKAQSKRHLRALEIGGGDDVPHVIQKALPMIDGINLNASFEDSVRNNRNLLEGRGVDRHHLNERILLVVQPGNLAILDRRKSEGKEELEKVRFEYDLQNPTSKYPSSIKVDVSTDRGYQVVIEKKTFSEVKDFFSDNRVKKWAGGSPFKLLESLTTPVKKLTVAGIALDELDIGSIPKREEFSATILQGKGRIDDKITAEISVRVFRGETSMDTTSSVIADIVLKRGKSTVGEINIFYHPLSRDMDQMIITPEADDKVRIEGKWLGEIEAVLKNERTQKRINEILNPFKAASKLR